MIESSCHCGAVRLAIACAPDEVTECNCSLCRSYGVLWAYYSPGQVQFTPPEPVTDTYVWNRKLLAFHRCRHCGCVTHWASIDPARDRMGVNARLMAPEIVARARKRRLDGAVTWKYFEG